MRVLGIDPGLSGAYALIEDAARYLAEPMPLIAGEIDLKTLRAEWKGFSVDLAVLEEPLSIPKMSRTSAMTFGQRCGRLEGLLAGLEIPYVTVRPQIWKKAILAGTAKDKAAAITFVTHMFPLVKLGRNGKPHDGMADALCIALWGRNVYGGE